MVNMGNSWKNLLAISCRSTKMKDSSEEKAFSEVAGLCLRNAAYLRKERNLSIINEDYRRFFDLCLYLQGVSQKFGNCCRLNKHYISILRRELWPLYSTCSLWQQLVDQTKEEARQKMALADMYAARLTILISQRTDDLQRISRKVILKSFIILCYISVTE